MKMFKVKVCGITRASDAELVARLGADMIGMIFYPDSPRNISLSKAKQILSVLPTTVDRVGVVVEPDIGWMLRLSEKLRLDYLQIHGRVTHKTISSIQKSGIKVIQAYGIGNSSDLLSVHKSKADLILLDNKVSKLYGGSGKTFDWSIKLPKPVPNMVLAGGINADNIAHGVRRFHPLVVDVNSGVESSPGTKSKRKLKLFFGACNKLRYG